MDETKGFKVKQQFSVRLTPEEADLATEITGEIFPEFNEFTTSRAHFMAFINRAVSVFKKSNQARPEDAEEIQLLNNEIGRLKILLDLTQKDCEDLKEAAMLLKAQAESAEADLINLQRTGMKLEENQIILSLNPVILAILDEEVEAAQKQTGKEFSKGDIIKNLIWDTIRRVSNYPLHKLWSSGEIAQKVKSIKEKTAAQ